VSMQVAWGSQAAVPRTHSLMGMSQRGPSMPVPAVPLTQVCWQLGAGGSKAPRADGVHPATGCWLSWATVCALSAMGLNASSEG
jgi:hypothetical protein